MNAAQVRTVFREKCNIGVTMEAPAEACLLFFSFASV